MGFLISYDFMITALVIIRNGTFRYNIPIATLRSSSCNHFTDIYVLEDCSHAHGDSLRLLLR